MWPGRSTARAGRPCPKLGPSNSIASERRAACRRIRRAACGRNRRGRYPTNRPDRWPTLPASTPPRLDRPFASVRARRISRSNSAAASGTSMPSGSLRYSQRNRSAVAPAQHEPVAQTRSANAQNVDLLLMMRSFQRGCEVAWRRGSGKRFRSRLGSLIGRPRRFRLRRRHFSRLRRPQGVSPSRIRAQCRRALSIFCVRSVSRR